MIRLLQLKRIDKNTVDDLRSLMRQLSSDPKKARQTTSLRLRQLVRDRNVVILVLKDGSKILGTASLILIPKLYGSDASIEDVVVDDKYRGRGLGKKLTAGLIREARKRKVFAIHLTSRPLRVAANGLYKKFGFQQKETNYYTLRLRG